MFDFEGFPDDDDDDDDEDDEDEDDIHTRARLSVSVSPKRDNFSERIEPNLPKRGETQSNEPREQRRVLKSCSG